MKKLWVIFTRIFLYFIVFIAALYRTFDFDLGWHLKYGEYFLTHHEVLRTNIFSTLLPNYYWVNHAWGTDVIMYIIFHNFGFLGLTVFGSAIVTLTFYFFAKAARLTTLHKLILFPLLLYLEHPFYLLSTFRPESVSIFLISILVYLLSEYDRRKTNKILLIIPLFLFWANLHGEFILGQGVYFLWMVLHLVKSITKKKGNESAELVRKLIRLGSIFCVSALVILINPYGFDVYTEALGHFFDPNLQYIVGWHRLPTFSIWWWQLIIVGGLYFWSVFLIVSRGKLNNHLPSIGIVLALFGLSLLARRYVWPFYFFTLPFLAILLEKYLPNLGKKYLEFILLLGIIFVSIFVFAIKAPFGQYKSMSWDIYCSVQKCSSDAAEFLIQHNLSSDPNLFTLYPLGAWLIWNYPQIKPTIDGRMTLWRDRNGYNPLAEYIPIEQNLKDIDKSEYSVVFASNNRPIFNRLMELTIAGGWEILYQDKVTAIFARKKDKI